MRIIDLHTHILPGVDDGATDWQDALNMLNNAAAGQTEVVVATPHCNVPGWYNNYLTEELIGKFRRLIDETEKADIPVQVLPGMEVHATPDLAAFLRSRQVIGVNDSRYLLTELPAGGNIELDTKLLHLVLSEGFVPLIAHPERYPAVWESPGAVEKWVKMGCHLQLTGGSILGKFGKKAQKCSEFMLNEDFTACVASDAHGVDRRTNFLGEVYTYLEINYSAEYAQTLLWNNPLRICKNEPI